MSMQPSWLGWIMHISFGLAISKNSSRLESWDPEALEEFSTVAGLLALETACTGTPFRDAAPACGDKLNVDREFYYEL